MSSSALPTINTASASASNNQQQTAASTASATRQTASGSTGSATATVASATGTQTNLPTIGADTSSTSISSLTNAPSLSTARASGGLTLSNLPTLSGAFSYPPASVPPTNNAPYMATSQLPQNFVFIIVGGVMAFVLLIVVLWRFLTAWSINRAFKKDSAALYTPLPEIKKKPHKQDKDVDMADLSNAKLPKSFNSVPNLFFSPTAEAARQSMIRPLSQHMPSGHYRDASK